MRTIKHILITGCIALAVSSCDYLDQQPYEYWQPELYSIPRRVYR